MRKLVVLAIALAVTGCATKPMAWARADGKTFELATLSLDQTVCRGDMQKANLSVPNNSRGIGTGYALADVFIGCMATHGWVQVPADPVLATPPAG